MKNKLFIIALLSMAFITGCDNTSSNTIKVTGTNDENIIMLAKQSILSFSSLDNMTLGVKLNKKELSDNQIEDIKKTLSQVDVLLSKEHSIEVNKLSSDKQDYAYKLQLSYSNKNIYLYYNDIYEETEIDYDELETKTFFKGIAMYENNEYKFTFESEFEEEYNETEKESKLKIFTDAASYIEITNENEKEFVESKMSYNYKKVVNGNEIMDYEFSLKEENRKRKVEVEINETEYELKYYEKDNKQYILVELDDYENHYLFEKVITKNEDGSENTNYIYIK